MTKMEWIARQSRLDRAGKQADELISVLGLTAPIEPHKIIKSERSFLRAGGRDFGDSYDGKLEYHRSKNRFLLFYNTKYEQQSGVHHPRTRFSICHELGHYFLDDHRAYLMSPKGKSHGSHTEFTSDNMVEREADAFAASLLLPTALARPVINASQLSMDRIHTIAADFNTSIVCTTFRSVRLSHFPSAVAGIRDGAVRWLMPSESLIEHGIYLKRDHLPQCAQQLWLQFQMGVMSDAENAATVDDWFQVYEEEFTDIEVWCEYLPIPSLSAILVLLTLNEDDLLEDEKTED